MELICLAKEYTNEAARLHQRLEDLRCILPDTTGKETLSTNRRIELLQQEIHDLEAISYHLRRHYLDTEDWEERGRVVHV